MQTKGYLWMVVSLTWCFSIHAQDREAQLEYANKYLNLAVGEMRRAGVPVSIKLGQAILESRWGTGELAVLANNHFGIKCGGVWDGPTYYKEDDEYDAQGRLVKSCFRHFDAAETSFYAHSEFLRDPTKLDRYGFLFELDALDYKSWARGLRKAGYATDKDYHHKLIHIIESLELYRYDALALQQSTAATSTVAPRWSQRTVADIAVLAPLAMRWIRSVEQQVDHGRYGAAAHPLALWCYNPFSDHPSRVLTYLKKAYPSTGKKGGKSIPGWHRVRPNELMADISGQYGLAIEGLYHRNRLSEGAEVASGEMVKLKGGRVDKAPALRPGPPQYTSPVPATTTAGNDKADPFFQPAPKAREAKPYHSVPVEVRQPRGVETESTMPMGASPPDPGTATPEQPTTQRYHVVKSGETLWSIARQYQLSVEQLKTMNRLYNDVIVPGVALRVE
jgi:hypothetical protein